MYMMMAGGDLAASEPTLGRRAASACSQSGKSSARRRGKRVAGWDGEICRRKRRRGRESETRAKAAAVRHLTRKEDLQAGRGMKVDHLPRPERASETRSGVEPPREARPAFMVHFHPAASICLLAATSISTTL